MKTILSSKTDHYLARVGFSLIMVALIAGMAGCGDGGTLTVEIQDWYDLYAIRDNLSDSYLLMNDLDSTTAGYEELAGPTANEGKGWQPIGSDTDRFIGSFDGQGYKIRDLFIVPLEDEDVFGIGLFGVVGREGVVKNLAVVNVVVTGNLHNVGGLVGVNWGTVSNSYSSGTITGYDFVGGLVGWSDGTVTNSSSTSSVTGQERAGGLMGWNENLVTGSYSTGNVIGQYYTGGLVGTNYGTVNKCYATGNVTSAWWAGGLVGYSLGGFVSNSYATGNVIGGWWVGGLVGYSEGDSVSYSHSTGTITGGEHVGGLVGCNEGSTVSNSFWDIETSGQATSDGGTGKNTEEMQSIATFSDAGWNIIAVTFGQTNPDYTWNIEQAYPFLSWQP